jgi:hypothetical protein
MPGGEDVSGKPRRPSIRGENLARFAKNAGQLDLTFLDRDGEPMSADRWIEARTDPDYLLVAVDRIECLEVATTWIGVHLNGTPNWECVIFGTQIVYLHPEDLERLDGPPPHPAEFLPEDPGESFNPLSLVAPIFGELVGRYGWRNLSDAGAGHRFAVDYFRERLAASGGSILRASLKPSDV